MDIAGVKPDKFGLVRGRSHIVESGRKFIQPRGKLTANQQRLKEALEKASDPLPFSEQSNKKK